MTEDAALDKVRHEALWFEPVAEGMRPLLDAVADAPLVLIGEASHGTQEFYRIRTELTKVLIREHGFNLVAVEADWPDAYRVNRWVRGLSDDPTAEAALSDFMHFPQWMWRNHEIVAFLNWLHDRNVMVPESQHAGFYGLDLYSLHRSIEAVLGCLRKVDPDAAERARWRYACFEMFGEDPQPSGYASSIGMTPACEAEVTAQLIELQRRAHDYASRDGRIDAGEYFFAEQNARLIANSETYYRAMFSGRAESWNMRDRHMLSTLLALLAYTERTVGSARAVVWAHNSHLGDARATQMAAAGEINLGQLVREHYGDRAWLVGFTTHEGTVTAARNWDEPAEKRRVRPSLPGSYERLFHDTGLSRFMLLLRHPEIRGPLCPQRLERAIGVIYRPGAERISHYFRARLADQFDAVLHIDQTSALEPLERWAHDASDLPETYPFGV